MVSAVQQPGLSAGRLRRSGAGNGTITTAISIAAVWVALIIATTAYDSHFMSRDTVFSVAFTMAVAGVLTVGQALVTISGGIFDLSVSTALILPSWVIASMLADGASLVVTIGAGLAVGIGWGGMNAAIVTIGRLNPIIVTLATNLIGAALLNIYVGNAVVPITSGLAAWGKGETLGLPNVFWPMVVVVAATGYLLPRTRMGRRAIAVGGNPVAAKSRGISLTKTRFGIFMLSGLFAGVAAVLFTASQPTFISSDGAPYLFTAIAGSLVAGIRISGGSGNLWTIFLSVGLLSTVPTSLAFFGVSSVWQSVPPGVILVVAVAVEGVRRKRASG